MSDEQAFKQIVVGSAVALVGTFAGAVATGCLEPR